MNCTAKGCLNEAENIIAGIGGDPIHYCDAHMELLQLKSEISVWEQRLMVMIGDMEKNRIK